MGPPYSDATFPGGYLRRIRNGDSVFRGGLFFLGGYSTRIRNGASYLRRIRNGASVFRGDLSEGVLKADPQWV